MVATYGLHVAMNGLELPEDMDWSANELIELIAAGLTPAEAVDYWATEGRGISQKDWARTRDTSRQAINKNVKNAQRKL